MTQPRIIEPGIRYFITRRTFHRIYRLRPGPDTYDIIAYCFAMTLAKFGMLAHALCVMSDHYHAVFTDVRGNLPQFMHALNLNLTRALNLTQHQSESLWSSDGPCVQRLATLDYRSNLSGSRFSILNGP